MTLEQYLATNRAAFDFLSVPMPTSSSEVQGGMDIGGGVGGGEGCTPSRDAMVVHVPFYVSVPVPRFNNTPNIHYCKRDIELALKGWQSKGNELDYGQNVSKLRAAISESNPGLDIHAEILSAGNHPSDHDLIGLYAQTGTPKIPDEVLSHARHFRKLERRGNPVAFLMGVYKQVVHDQKGQYADMFARQDPHTAPILHYFTDKLYQYGMDREAMKLNGAVDSRFPVGKPEINRGISVSPGITGGSGL